MNKDRFKFRAWDKHSDTFTDGCMTYFNIHKEIGDVDIIMQCIGDWDKNNKLIYEGDLLRYKDETQEYLFEVAFDQEDFQFKFFFRGNNYYSYEFELSECEIVGNIYENPELIKI